MPLFSNDTITRFTNEGESTFASEFKCIKSRLALEIVAGTSQYTLPEYILDITRITWLGTKVVALNQRELRESNQKGTETSAKPYSYIFNNIGQLKIQFFPTPNVSIVADQTNLYGSNIRYQVIVEFWRAPDHSQYVIPLHFRGRLLSVYSLCKLFAIEGRGQNIKAAKYYTDKWKNWKELYYELLTELSRAPKRISKGISSLEPTFLSPHKDISKFGIGVDLGE